MVPFYIYTGDHGRFDIDSDAALIYQAPNEFQSVFTKLRIFDEDFIFDTWQGNNVEAMPYVEQDPVLAARSETGCRNTDAAR